MSDDTIGAIQERWRFFDPYLQRVLINRFLDIYGTDSSREDWLEFLVEELDQDEGN